jgi:predicted metal-dependent HD superfamily phosphohydrolase
MMRWRLKAIWFHDVVYQPQVNDNKQQSAQVMRESCHDCLTPIQLEKVAQWIEATAEHLPTQEIDLQYLLDIDLAILASSPKRFAQYQDQIRLEYAGVAPNRYIQRRMQRLSPFNQQHPLYHT